jgi:hypothetical protein
LEQVVQNLQLSKVAALVITDQIVLLQVELAAHLLL